MIIVMPAQAGAVHNLRWSRGLAGRSHRVVRISNRRLTVPNDEIETIILPGTSSVAYVYNLPRVRKIIHRIRPDIVHAQYATGYGLWGSCQSAAPLVLTVWGTDIEDALDRKPVISWLVRRALKKAQGITAASRFLVERTIEFEPSIADKIQVIPFGVPMPKISEAKPGRDDTVQLVYTKNFRPAYAPDIALEAFAAASRKNPKIRLTMVGGGPMRSDLLRLAKERGISDRVDILGWQTMDQTEKLIRQTDIMLMPSRPESFGVAALEAHSHGKPVIATRVGGIAEIVRDNVSGILVPPDDVTAVAEAILRLTEDRSLRLRMGREGRKLVEEKYDFEECLDQMETLYNRIASGQDLGNQ